MTHTFGSLFSGIGGIDLGLERAGWTCAWQVENDPYARAVLAKHWPRTLRYGDIRTVGPELTPVSLIAGGFPCQPFSSASRGRRNGCDDPRWLWPEMRRIVEFAHPAWVLVENVTHFDGPALEQVVVDLEALNYEVAPPVEVPSCAFGYDHWRPRLWLCGHANRDRQPGRPLHAEVAELPRSGGESRSMGTPYGVSHRMDRLRGIGNAVSPDIAEWFGRMMYDL